MKKKYFFGFLFFAIISSQAQFNCGFIEAQEYLFKTDKTAKKRFENLMKEAETSANQNSKVNAVANYTIPVVFHVLHLGGSENISDAQIYSAMNVLNRDYLKQNSDTANIVSQFVNLAAKCNIEFRLATIDPDGKCTNGITRHYDTLTNWKPNLSYYQYTWPASKYLNIYVVKTMQSGAAAYTYLPGTAPGVADAIIALSNYVGNIGTANNYVSRTLTHEVGHWLNLQHTWGSTNQPGVTCGDDGVSDTPITKGHSNCNLFTTNFCTSGVTENIQNYMEYSYCTNMFTVDQKTRMHNALNSLAGGRNNIWSTPNLIATGVISPNTNCAPKAEFIATSTITCLGNAVNFTDLSYNASISNWKWSSAFASNTSTLQNGMLTFTNSGIAPVQLKVSNTFGSDSTIKASVVVLAANGSGNLNVVKDFETGVFPDNNWIASYPKYGSSYATYSASASTGSNCLWVNNFFDNPSEVISLYSPSFNLQNVLNAQLNFKYAYAQQSASNNDALKVYVSTNCGINWTLVYNKSGTTLNSTGTIQTVAFLNPTSNDWKSESVSLGSLSGNADVYLKFEFMSDVNGSGNNLFLDDINVSDIVGIRVNELLGNASIYPNPSNDRIIVEMIKTSSFDVVVTNTLGQTIIQKMVNNEKNTEIDLSKINTGIYFVTINDNGFSKTIKLIKN
ncbi:MAG: M43 family zinc metalloprotease [Bacteroidota bacterium]|nr:M43 family zinc metalloprotease [Bacteroidota bacterium]